RKPTVNKKTLLGIVAAAALLQGATANASLIGTLSFIEPTGTVTANESIQVWVRLTLDANSDPLTYNPTDPFPAGLDPDLLPLEGRNRETGEIVPFESYSFASPFVSRGCDDTFTVGCSDPGSQYSFESASSNSWFNFTGSLGSGDSLDFMLYTLTPTDGTATPGTYELFTAGLGFLVFGEDADGNELLGEVLRFDTDCGGPECTFTRTVSAVPLPAAAWLLGSALLGVFGASRRAVA
ncbi:MAG: VPLPA-CTERM sorting domain-containing protein, partial [Pseudomonadota bacterium]